MRGQFRELRSQFQGKFGSKVADHMVGGSLKHSLTLSFPLSLWADEQANLESLEQGRENHQPSRSMRLEGEFRFLIFGGGD